MILRISGLKLNSKKSREVRHKAVLGGSLVNGLVAGTGIALEDNGQGVFTISNGGVLNVIEGAGIEMTSNDQEFTINNTGVLALTAGTGIEMNGGNDDKI